MGTLFTYPGVGLKRSNFIKRILFACLAALCGGNFVYRQLNPAKYLTGQLSVFLSFIHSNSIFYAAIAVLAGLVIAAFGAFFLSGKVYEPGNSAFHKEKEIIYRRRARLYTFLALYLGMYALGFYSCRAADVWPSVTAYIYDSNGQPTGTRKLSFTELEDKNITGYGKLLQSSYDEEKGEAVLLLGDVILDHNYEGKTGRKLKIVYTPSDITATDNAEAKSGSVNPASSVYRTWHIGQHISFQGTFSLYSEATNPGAFDYRAYCFSQGILGEVEVNESALSALDEGSRFRTMLQNIRNYMIETIDTLAEDDDAGILICILTGDKSRLSAEWKDLYKDGGILHLLSISGLHISILGMALYQLMRKLVGDYAISAMVSGVVTGCFCLMAGSGTSAVRAAICFGLHLGADWLGRKYDLITAVSVAGIFLLLEHPLLLYQSGFLMTFTCMFGIGFLVSCVNWMFRIPGERLTLQEKPLKYAASTNKIARNHTQRTLMAFLQASFMQTSSLVVVLWFQGSTNLLSPLVNMLAIPLMSYVLLSDLLAVAMGSIAKTLGIASLGPAHYILAFYAGMCKVCEKMTSLQITTGRPKVLQVILWLLLMAAAMAGARYLVCYRKKLVPYLAGILLLPCSVFILTRLPSADVQLTFLDVGQGDGIVMELPGGDGIFCIDGGSSSNMKLAEYVYEPYFSYIGADHVDCWLLTHPDSDHYSGLLELLEEGFPITHLYMPEIFKDSDLAAELEALHEVEYVHTGNEWNLGKVMLQVLHPSVDYSTEDENDGSCVVLLKDGNFSALLTGDLEEAGEQDVIKVLSEVGQQQVDVLKLGHHGSRSSSSEAFLEAVNPEYAVISAGLNNRYGHPHEEVLNRIGALDIPWNNTAYAGAVMVNIKENGYRINTFCDGEVYAD